MATLNLQNALCTLADAKTELGISGSTYDASLYRKINTASAAIEAYCGRSFALAYMSSELISAPVTYGPRLRLQRVPLRPEGLLPGTVSGPVQVSTNSLPGPGTALTYTSDFDVEDYARGVLYNDARWYPTALRQMGIVQDWEARTEKRTLSASYIGGSVTQPQIEAAAAWTSGAVTLGTLVVPSTQTNELWMCVTAGTTAGSQPTWGAITTLTAARPELGGLTASTVTDGTVVWAFMGSVDGSGAYPAKTIFDLEEACISTVVSLYRNKGVDTHLTSESLLGASQSWGGTRGVLSPLAIQILDQKYRRIPFA